MIGVIADDFTGATDIAGLLARSGAAVRLSAGHPERPAPPGTDAFVIALKCRTSPVTRAVAETGRALDRLLEGGADRIYWKYCSTFDSTPEGNIGPVAEALMARLGTGRTVYCPAFPENGRTVYQGHLFVGDKLLSDSPMRDHPLTPMTDSSLLRLLAPQVSGRIGLIALHAVAAGPGAVADAADALAEGGRVHIVADAVSNADLACLGRAFAGWPLLTGGSAFAAAAYADRLRAVDTPSPLPRVPDGPAILLSGSCSAATREQVARARAAGVRVIDLAARGLAGVTPEHVAADVATALGGRPLLVTTTAEPEALRAVQAQMGRDRAGAHAERLLAAAASTARRQGATRIVVAGGETAGAVTLALGATDLRVGREIAPGVPWCFASDPDGVFAVALKSGNFGGPDFFADALAALEGA